MITPQLLQRSSDLTSEEHGGLEVQLFHFLGEQRIQLALQSTHSSLAAVEDGTWRQHWRRVQTAQTAEAATAAEAAVAKKQGAIWVCTVNRPVTKCTIVEG